MTINKPIIWAYTKIGMSEGKEGGSSVSIQKGLYNRKDKRRIFCSIHPFNEIFYEMKFKTFNDCPTVFNFTEEQEGIDDDLIEPATLEGCIVAVGDTGGRIVRHSVTYKERAIDEVVIFPWNNPYPEVWFDHLQEFYEGKIKLYNPATSKSRKPSQRVICQYLEKILRGIEVEPVQKCDQDELNFIVYGRE